MYIYLEIYIKEMFFIIVHMYQMWTVDAFLSLNILNTILKENFRDLKTSLQDILKNL